jgi:hypothetical protein
VIDEISFVGARMFDVINSMLRSIKHIQNFFLGDLNIIMTCDFYQVPHMKDNWIFQNIENNVNALTPIFLANIHLML